MNRVMQPMLCLVFFLASGFSTGSAQAMKRSVENADDTKALVVTNGIVPHSLGLTADPIQKILAACPNKWAVMQVCKLWHVLSNFEKNWMFFIKSADIFRTLHISPGCSRKLFSKIPELCAQDKKLSLPQIQIDLLRKTLACNPDNKATRLRLYRLLLDGKSKFEYELLEQLLASDTHLEKNMKKLQKIILRPLSQLQVDTHIQGILDTYALKDKAPVYENHVDDVVKDYVAELSDAIVRADDTALEILLKNTAMIHVINTEELNYECVCDRLVRSGLICKFCSLTTLKKLIPFLRTVESPEKDRLIDVLLLKCFSTGPCSDRLTIARCVLEHGANQKYIENQCPSIFESIIENRDIDGFYLMQEHGATLKDYKKAIGSYSLTLGENDYHFSPLMYHVVNGEPVSPEFLQEFINLPGNDPFKIHQNPEVGDLVFFAQQHQSPEIVDIILKARYCRKYRLDDERSLPPLLQAIKDGDLSRVEQIVTKDFATLFEYDSSSVCSSTSDPLVYALVSGHKEIIHYILFKRAEHFTKKCYTIFINEHTGDISVRSAEGFTQYTISPLMYAVCTGRTWLVRRLCELGYCYLEEDSQSPRLGKATDLARRLGNQDIVQLLETQPSYNPTVAATIGLYMPSSDKYYKWIRTADLT